MTAPVRRVARGVTAVAVSAFLAVLAWYLPKPGYTHLRLALFGGLAGFALLGGIGVVRGRPWWTAAGVAGLFLLGFWQAVLWVFVYPVIAVLVAAAVLGGGADGATGA